MTPENEIHTLSGDAFIFEQKVTTGDFLVCMLITIFIVVYLMKWIYEELRN